MRLRAGPSASFVRRAWVAVLMFVAGLPGVALAVPQTLVRPLPATAPRFPMWLQPGDTPLAAFPTLRTALWWLFAAFGCVLFLAPPIVAPLLGRRWFAREGEAPSRWRIELGVALLTTVLVAWWFRVETVHARVFNVEYEGYLTLASLCLRNVACPIVGQPISMLQAHLGPLFYQLLTPLLALVPSPDALLDVVLVLAAASIASTAWLAARLGSPIAAPVTVMCAIVGDGLRWTVGTPQHAALAPLPMSAFLWTLFAWARGGGTVPFVLLVASLAATVQLHAIGGILVLAALVVAAVFRPRTPRRALVAGALIVAVVSLPGLANVVFGVEKWDPGQIRLVGHESAVLTVSAFSPLLPGTPFAAAILALVALTGLAIVPGAVRPAARIALASVVAVVTVFVATHALWRPQYFVVTALLFPLATGLVVAGVTRGRPLRVFAMAVLVACLGAHRAGPVLGALALLVAYGLGVLWPELRDTGRGVRTGIVVTAIVGFVLAQRAFGMLAFVGLVVTAVARVKVARTRTRAVDLAACVLACACVLYPMAIWVVPVDQSRYLPPPWLETIEAVAATRPHWRPIDLTTHVHGVSWGAYDAATAYIGARDLDGRAPPAADQQSVLLDGCSAVDPTFGRAHRLATNAPAVIVDRHPSLAPFTGEVRDEGHVTWSGALDLPFADGEMPPSARVVLVRFDPAYDVSDARWPLLLAWANGRAPVLTIRTVLGTGEAPVAIVLVRDPLYAVQVRFDGARVEPEPGAGQTAERVVVERRVVSAARRARPIAIEVTVDRAGGDLPQGIDVFEEPWPRCVAPLSALRRAERCRATRP